MSNPTATFASKLPHMPGDARLYELSTPLHGYRWVVVATVNLVPGGPATYVLGSSSTGDDLADHWLPGWLKGTRDHVAALYAAGYTALGDPDGQQ